MAFERRNVSHVSDGNSGNIKPKRKSRFKQSQFSRFSYGKNGSSHGKKDFFSSTLWYIILGCFGFFVFCFIVIYVKIILPLPSVKELENLEISEASTIYDREGNELYKIFEEKRTYVSYENINKNIVNALVSGEDQRFWENPGVDFIGLIRAGIYGVIGKNEGFGGTSTLTQQLIRNTIIENRSSNESIFDKLERKIKEIYLAFKLTNGVSKEKILELYLNKIAYGSNAYGIEQASKTFFGKNAKDIGILEASMLASLPKGPSYYSPYNNYDRLVGYAYVYSGKDTDNAVNLISPASIEENKTQVDELKKYIQGFKTKKYSETKTLLCGLEKDKMKSSISVDSDGCTLIAYEDFLTLLNSIQIKSGEKTIEYQTGRKDFILGRMLEDSYISFEEYQKALTQSIGFVFNTNNEEIKAAHFVFYVREYLEKKYGEDILKTGGLKIYTSLDPKLQKKAEEVVKAQAEVNTSKYGAQNAALISLDNETGEILAMVGGRDYFDEEHKGNINMVTAALQPGSTFKPFVYALAIDQEQIGSKTPIYDVKTTFPGNYTPKNYDGSFMGKMNVSTALNYSRNIPAVKMFFLAGGEEKILNWMDKFGVASIREYKELYTKNSGKTYSYGASMALGSAMVTPLEWARAYSTFANLGVRKEVVPVLKILDSKGVVIEEFKKEQNQGERVIDASTAYIMNSILSDTGSRPSGWNSYISLSGRKAAAKTGTSTKQSSSAGGTVYPRNLWAVGYTPQITTVVWSGNNDGSQTYVGADGLMCSGPIWKKFMEFAHEGKPYLDWKMPSGVKSVSISELSGKLAGEGLPEGLIVGSLFKNAPNTSDNGITQVDVDLLCNGPVSDTTPISAVGKANIISLHSEKPSDPAWENPVQAWLKSSGYVESLGLQGDFVSSISSESCKRSGGPGKIQVGLQLDENASLLLGNNNIIAAYESSTPIKYLEVYLDNEKLLQYPVGEKLSGMSTLSVTIPEGAKEKSTLLIKAIDDQYYAESKSYSVTIGGSDSVGPSIELTNPASGSISQYIGNSFNLRATITDNSGIKDISVLLDDAVIHSGDTKSEFVYLVDTKDMPAGQHTLSIKATDTSGNSTVKNVTLSILEQ